MTVCESEPELDLLDALVLDPSLAWTRGLSVGLCEQVQGQRLGVRPHSSKFSFSHQPSLTLIFFRCK